MYHRRRSGYVFDGVVGFLRVVAGLFFRGHGEAVHLKLHPINANFLAFFVAKH